MRLVRELHVSRAEDPHGVSQVPLPLGIASAQGAVCGRHRQLPRSCHDLSESCVDRGVCGCLPSIATRHVTLAKVNMTEGKVFIHRFML